MKNRKGKIKILRSFLDGTSDYVFEVFGYLIPRFIEDNPVYDYVVYYCICPHFRELNNDEALPTYDAIITNGCVSFKIIPDEP